MAKLYIREYGNVGYLPAGAAQIGAEPGVDQIPVAIGGGSLQSAAFDGGTRMVRIHTDAICSIAFGVNPTATVNSARMAAGATEYFAVASGSKIAVISNT